MTTAPPVRSGEVIHVAEQDYRYGLGPLTLRVTAVHEVRDHADGPWVEVDGIPLGWNGHEGRQRHALIRVAGIRRLPRSPEPGTAP